MSVLGGPAQRIYGVLETGPRKLNVLSALTKSQPDFERAVGQLFIAGVVKWIGKTKGRMLARKS